MSLSELRKRIELRTRNEWNEVRARIAYQLEFASSFLSDKDGYYDLEATESMWSSHYLPYESRLTEMLLALGYSHSFDHLKHHIRLYLKHSAIPQSPESPHATESASSSSAAATSSTSTCSAVDSSTVCASDAGVSPAASATSSTTLTAPTV